MTFFAVAPPYGCALAMRYHAKGSAGLIVSGCSTTQCVDQVYPAGHRESLTRLKRTNCIARLRTHDTHKFGRSANAGSQ
jgi:hypothetical protein